MKPFDVACEHCGASFRVPDEQFVGRKVKCRNCRETFRVSAPALASVAAGVSNTAQPENGQHTSTGASAPGRFSSQRATASANMGISKDINRLKANSSAVAGELNDFLGQMRGKPPQEVLGLVAQSGLTQGILLATLATFVMMLTFTVLPYAYGKMVGGEDTAAKAPAAAESEPDPKTEDAPAASATAATDTDPDLAGAADKMGINETRDSDPAVNPLEGKMDNLLDDLK